MKKRQLSGKTLQIIGWCVIAACVIGGVVLGFVFKTEDHDVTGKPIMVMDVFLTLCVWLFGGLTGGVMVGIGRGRR